MMFSFELATSLQKVEMQPTEKEMAQMGFGFPALSDFNKKKHVLNRFNQMHDTNSVTFW